MIDDSVNKILGYESPIQIIRSQIDTNLEDNILKVTQSVGIDVNKEELVKSLTYDREQYKKGYDDGYMHAVDDFRKELGTSTPFSLLEGIYTGRIDERLLIVKKLAKS